MQIDLFTLVAQIINFLILAGVLWYFLFDRIVNAMNEREERISSRLEEAEQKKKEAEQEREGYMQKKNQLEDRREEIISQAKSQAEDRRKKMIQEARDQVEENKAEWKQALQKQMNSFLKELRERSGKQVYAVVRRVLRDLANEDMEKHIVEMFARRIEELDGDEKKDITEVTRESGDKITVVSTFDLTHDMRERIKNAVGNQLEIDVAIDFGKSSELISGIELRTNGRKVSWSLASYLDALEAHLSEAFERETEGERETDAEPS